MAQSLIYLSVTAAKWVRALKTCRGISEQRELVGTTILLRILKQLGPEFSGGDSKFPLFVFILQNEDRQNQRTFSFFLAKKLIDVY